MCDGLLLGEDRLFYDVIDRDDAAKRVVVEHRQIADVLVGQQLHTELDGILWFDVRQVRGHDLGDSHDGLFGNIDATAVMPLFG